jgi:hypothetical protein
MDIRKLRTIAGAVVVCSLAWVPASAGEPTAQELAQMMITTKMIAITNLSTPADKFVSDGDPDTLEVVFLSKPEDGPSRVSDDGEVVFVSPATSDSEQQALITKAFVIRWMRRHPAQ